MFLINTIKMCDALSATAAQQARLHAETTGAYLAAWARSYSVTGKHRTKNLLHPLQPLSVNTTDFVMLTGS